MDKTRDSCGVRVDWLDWGRERWVGKRCVRCMTKWPKGSDEGAGRRGRRERNAKAPGGGRRRRRRKGGGRARKRAGLRRRPPFLAKTWTQMSVSEPRPPGVADGWVGCVAGNVCSSSGDGCALPVGVCRRESESEMYGRKGGLNVCGVSWSHSLIPCVYAWLFAFLPCLPCILAFLCLACLSAQLLIRL